MVSYCKLHDGNWGLKGMGLEPNKEVSVQTKAGKTKKEKVGRIIWKNEDISIATIFAEEKHPSHCHECGRKFTCGCSPEEEVPF